VLYVAVAWRLRVRQMELAPQPEPTSSVPAPSSANRPATAFKETGYNAL